MTIDGNVFVLLNVVKIREDIYLITNKFNKKEDFYVYPFPSSLVRIFKVSHLGDQRIVVPLTDIQSKCWLITYPTKNFLFQFLFCILCLCFDFVLSIM